MILINKTWNNNIILWYLFFKANISNIIDLINCSKVSEATLLAFLSRT